jgi:hypothetical protein
MQREPRSSLEEAQRGSAHEEVSQTILLHAELSAEAAVDLAAGATRLVALWPPEAGAAPVPEQSSDPPQVAVRSLAEERLPPDRPCRVLVLGGRDVIVAAHHGVMDGLAMLRVMAEVVGTPLASSARGVGERATRRGGPIYAARRLGEALVAPPARVAPERMEAVPGEVLVWRDATGSSNPGTTGVVAATLVAAKRWNAERGASFRRPVVAVGAALVPGDAGVIRDQSAWFRLRIRDPSREALRNTLAEALPEPPAPAALRSGAASRVARLLRGRTGSTILVSSLGRVSPPGPVRAYGLWPWAHGRSGIAIGCATVGSVTTLTLRARASDFSESGARSLLDLVDECLE